MLFWLWCIAGLLLFVCWREEISIDRQFFFLHFICGIAQISQRKNEYWEQNVIANDIHGSSLSDAIAIEVSAHSRKLAMTIITFQFSYSHRIDNYYIIIITIILFVLLSTSSMLNDRTTTTTGRTVKLSTLDMSHPTYLNVDKTLHLLWLWLWLLCEKSHHYHHFQYWLVYSHTENIL